MSSLVLRVLRKVLPQPIYRALAAAVSPRFCMVCNTGCRRFTPFGDPVRQEAMCPHCRSLERHRLIWLFFNRETNLLNGTPQRMLHIAPEESLGWLFASTTSIDYVSGDLTPGRAMVALDVTRIAFPEASFDVVYASHVLEHVPEDRQAMREFFRVLKPGGWAVLQVPLVRDTTDEDPGVTDPEERRRRFGQDDHVRAYGRADYRARLEAAGFRVEVIAYPGRFTPQERVKFGLDESESIHLCRKVASAAGVTA